MKKRVGIGWRGAACLLAALLLFTACGGLDKQDPLSVKERDWVRDHEPIKVACDITYHPFAFLDDGHQPEGICVAMWKVMAQKLGFEVRFVPLEKPAQLNGLREGTLDSGTGMFRLPERRLFLDFSAPFYPVTTAIFVNSSSHGVRGLDDLRRIKVGAVKGDSGAGVLIKAGISPELFETYRRCVEALGQNWITAAVMDDPVMLYWRHRLKLGDKVSWAEGNAVVDRNDLALPVKKGNEVLLSILNKGVALVAGAEMQRIKERYLH